MDTERVNEVIGALRYRVWHFVGGFQTLSGMFQCWIYFGNRTYCLSYGASWDAVIVEEAGLTSGIWDAELTATLRKFAGQ